MKIMLPRGWFARILFVGWVLFILGIALMFAIGAVAPRAFHLITPLWMLSTLLALGTFGYAGVSVIRRFWYYVRALRNGANFTSIFSPVERILVAGWAACVVAALGSLPLSRYKWVQTFGAEILIVIFIIVVLSSLLYASYMLIRRMGYFSRR